MDGYGGESSFKARGIGDYYDEDYGEYPPAVAPAGAPKAACRTRPNESGLLPRAV